MHFSLLAIILALATSSTASVIGDNQHRPGFTQHQYTHSDGQTYAIYVRDRAAGTLGGGTPPPPAVSMTDSFQWVSEPGSAHQYCDVRRALYHNMTGTRGDSDAQHEHCAAVAGWLAGNRGYFAVPGTAWNDDAAVLTGRDYASLVYSSHCGFAVIRSDTQPEPLHVGDPTVGRSTISPLTPA